MEESTSSSGNNSSLISDGNQEENSASEQFASEFAKRYGTVHPKFFTGSLKDCVDSSLKKKTDCRRPLALYLHNSSSVLANIYCSQILCTEAVASLLDSDFVTFGWDVTLEYNRKWLNRVVLEALGSGVADVIRKLDLGKFPVTIIINRVKGVMEILNVMDGTSTRDEFFNCLLSSVDIFKNGLSAEKQAEQEREERDQIKSQQDEAYAASLKADREKAEAKKREEENRNKRIKLAKEEADMRQAVRESLLLMLPPEPGTNTSDPVSHIRIRLPSGRMVDRKFQASVALSVLWTFLGSEGYSQEEYVLAGSWPRRTFTAQDDEKTLKELNLFPKETLYLMRR